MYYATMNRIGDSFEAESLDELLNNIVEHYVYQDGFVPSIISVYSESDDGTFYEYSDLELGAFQKDIDQQVIDGRKEIYNEQRHSYLELEFLRRL